MEGFRERFAEHLDAVPDTFFDEDRFVPATGSLDADVVLIGEAPGANEVEQGEPFVGRAGTVLDDVLKDIGVARDALYITNLVKIRPPDNRDPTREEIDAWRPLLDAELERVDPETIVTLGNFATKELTGTSKGISQVHGKAFRYQGWKVVPAYHPAATLYDRSKLDGFKKDLLTAFGRTEQEQTTLDDL